MRKDDPDQLLIVSDFDWTLTKYEELDGKNHSSYGIFILTRFDISITIISPFPFIDIIIFSELVLKNVKDEVNFP